MSEINSVNLPDGQSFFRVFYLTDSSITRLSDAFYTKEEALDHQRRLAGDIKAETLMVWVLDDEGYIVGNPVLQTVRGGVHPAITNREQPAC